MPTGSEHNMWSRSWRVLAELIYRNAQSKGFDSHQHEGIGIALMHSELSEALEAYRMGNPESKTLAGFSQVEEELADVVIRIMDHGYARGYQIADAVWKKMLVNKMREEKHGGKLY